MVLTGLAGQGLVFAGTILANAVGLHEDRYVSQLGYYSTNVRTGPSRSEVVVGDEEIDFPAATQPDIVVALTEAEARSYALRMSPTGILIMDSDFELDASLDSLSVHKVPLLEIARLKFGEELSVNLVALGVLAAVSEVVALESLIKTVAEYSPGPRGEKGQEALDEGYRAGLLSVES